MEKINFLTHYRGWVNYFSTIKKDIPELKTIEEIENTEDWKRTSIEKKTWILASFCDWVKVNRVYSPTPLQELENLHQFYTEINNDLFEATEEMLKLADHIHTLPTKESKLNCLNRELAYLAQYSGDFEGSKEVEAYKRNYLKTEIEYWEKYRDEPSSEQGANEKIKWLGTPAQFGYIMTELIGKGFVEPPLYNGEPNFSGLTRLCFQAFNIDTTPGNLKNEMNPKRNTLSDTKRQKFTIPNISDLA